MTGKVIKGILIVLALCFFLFPIYWIVATSFKQWPDIFAIPPKFFFSSTSLHYEALFNLNLEEMAKFGQAGESLFPPRFLNSIIIAGVSTLLSVALGTFSAYAFSRFKVRGEGDLLFFILSTRMLPPIVVGIPFFVLYRALHLIDTHVGMILIYMTFNLSFAVWLMKGFIDEIPREFEEAAMVDGYTRWEAFLKVILPQALSGIAATAVFCLITAWNEFFFALILTSERARTAPPSIAAVQGTAGINWGQIAAGVTVFLLPVVIFTFLVRGYLARGLTFGVIKR